MNNRIATEIERGIARVRLNRPDKRNALDLGMFEALATAQKSVAGLRGLRAVVLCAAGEDFCSGLDVKSMMGNRRAMLKLLWKWLPWRPNLAQRATVGWRELRAPVIAAIRGRCWGGGLQIALGADFRIAEPQASLSIMEGRWGLIPDMGGTLALRDIMRRDLAMRLAMTAETLDADSALAQGLLTAVAADPENLAGLVKRLYRRSWTGTPGSALARETLYQSRILLGKNQRIAVRRELGEDLPWREH
jgi:enoyl-CoA hydratase/carnithine racemase